MYCVCACVCIMCGFVVCVCVCVCVGYLCWSRLEHLADEMRLPLGHSTALQHLQKKMIVTEEQIVAKPFHQCQETLLIRTVAVDVTYTLAIIKPCLHEERQAYIRACAQPTHASLKEMVW